MDKWITITTCHSSMISKQAEIKPAIGIKLQGGSPWFGYIWIDDVCHTIIKSQRSIKIKKTNSNPLCIPK